MAQAYQAIGLTTAEMQILAKAQKKRDYYYRSVKGRRLFELGLGPAALALVGASSEHGPALSSTSWSRRATRATTRARSSSAAASRGRSRCAALVRRRRPPATTRRRSRRRRRADGPDDRRARSRSSSRLTPTTVRQRRGDDGAVPAARARTLPRRPAMAQEGPMNALTRRKILSGALACGVFAELATRAAPAEADIFGGDVARPPRHPHPVHLAARLEPHQPGARRRPTRCR